MKTFYLILLSIITILFLSSCESWRPSIGNCSTYKIKTNKKDIQIVAAYYYRQNNTLYFYDSLGFLYKKINLDSNENVLSIKIEK